MKSRDVNNFVAAPIYFSDNTFYGFLGVDNPGLNFHSVDMLCFMSLGFSMAFENLEEHKRIERMGMYVLTQAFSTETVILTIFIIMNRMKETSWMCIYRC